MLSGKTTLQESNISGENRVSVCIFSSHHSIRKRKEMIFLHKLLIMSVILDELGFSGFLIKELGISPFVQCLEGKNALQFASEKQQSRSVEMITGVDYFYIHKNSIMNLGRKMTKKDLSDFNTGMHFSALRNRENNFEILQKANPKTLEMVNARNWRPVECSRDPGFKKREIEEANSRFVSLVEGDADLLVQPEGRNPNLSLTMRHKYIYLIVCRDQQEDPKKTLLFSQLNRINNLHEHSKKKGNEQFQTEENVVNEINSTQHKAFINKTEKSNGKGDYLFTESDVDESGIDLLDNRRGEPHKYIEFSGNLLNIKWIELSDFKQKKVRAHGFQAKLKGEVLKQRSEDASYATNYEINKIVNSGKRKK